MLLVGKNEKICINFLVFFSLPTALCDLKPQGYEGLLIHNGFSFKGKYVSQNAERGFLYTYMLSRGLNNGK